MPGSLLWVPGPWGDDLGRYAEDIVPEPPTEPEPPTVPEPPTEPEAPKGKKSKAPAPLVAPSEPATLGESIST